MKEAHITVKNITNKQWVNLLLELNLVNEAQLLLEYNKDLTLEEAEDIIAENKQKNEKLSIFEKARQAAQRTTEL